jgi:hypothetical protein
VLEAALHGDGVESLANPVDETERLDAVLPLHLFCNQARRCEDARPLLPEGLQQCRVFELADHLGVNPE